MFLDAHQHFWKYNPLEYLWINEKMGVLKKDFLPDDLIKEMEETKSKSEKSIEIAVRLINELKPLCQGVHIMPLGWDKKVPAILEKAGL